MSKVFIRTGGQDPTYDGDINLYESAEVNMKSWFNKGARVIYVNGMDTKRPYHAKMARLLSMTVGSPVIGVYNQTEGFWTDIGQCITDKIKFSSHYMAEGITTSNMTLKTQNIAMMRAVTDKMYEVERKRNPSLTKKAFIGEMLVKNRATARLYWLLADMSAAQRSTTPIYCHSQGNLITSNALTALELLLGPGGVKGLEVNCFGSPCRYWPNGLKRTNYAFSLDAISWGDTLISFENVKVGTNWFCHGFNTYMDAYAEFTVNRFRWGSLGMTANMDEDGLAEHCVSLGRNVPRLKKIFERLEDAHWSDSDDVAYLYVKKMRAQGKEADLKATLAADADYTFLQLLIRLLEAGWTANSENKTITYLQGLLDAHGAEQLKKLVSSKYRSFMAGLADS